MENINNILKNFAEAVIKNIQENIASYGLANGNLYNSLDYTIEGNELTITSVDYISEAEKGRGPGAVPDNFVEILEEWIVRRRIQTPNVHQFAVNIARITELEGSYLYRNPEERRDFIGTSIEDNIGDLEQEFLIWVVKSYKDIKFK